MSDSDNEPVLACYAIKDDQEALDCIRDLVRAGKDQEDGCRPRLILFSQENCVPCAEEQDRFKADIAEGIVEVVDINSDEGLALAKKADVDIVPMLAVVNCEGQPIVVPD